MRLDFSILFVIFILLLFLTGILSYFIFLPILLVVLITGTFLKIFVSERRATQKRSENTAKKKTSPVVLHDKLHKNLFQYPQNSYLDSSMTQRNGYPKSPFNQSQKILDSSFDRWRSPTKLGIGLRTQSPKVSRPVSRRHSFCVKSSLDRSLSDDTSRIPFLPTVKRALGLDTIISPRYTGFENYSNYTSHPEVASPGFVPAVRLARHDKHPLSKMRPSVVRSPNTIKIAPPDISHLGSPRLLRRRDPSTPDVRKTPDMQTVLTALKEKRRKRTAGPVDGDMFSSEVPLQKAKRRRQESQQSNASTSSLPPFPASLPDLSITDYSIPRLETPSLKRAAASPGWEGQSSSAKRLRQEGRYNSISSSLSSSRCLDRPNKSFSPRPNWPQESVFNRLPDTTADLKRAIQREIMKITREMPSDVVTSLRMQYEKPSEMTGKENDAVTANTDRPDQSSSVSLQRAETVILTPGLETVDESLDSTATDNSTLNQSQSMRTDTRAKVTLNKSFSVRKRQMSLYSGLNQSFSKVPQSNVVASIDDYEADREAEQRRVDQMLEDIVSDEQTATTKADIGSTINTTTGGVTSATLTTTVGSKLSSTATGTSTSSVPSQSVNSLFVTKPTVGQTTSKPAVSINFGIVASSATSSTQNSSLPLLGAGIVSSPSSTLEAGTKTTMSAVPAMSSGIQNPGPTPVSTTPTNLSFKPVFGTVSSGTTTAYPSSISSSSPTDISTTASGLLASIVQGATTNIPTSASLANAFGLNVGKSETVGSALASAISSGVSPSTTAPMFNMAAVNSAQTMPGTTTGFAFGIPATTNPSSAVATTAFVSTAAGTTNKPSIVSFGTSSQSAVVPPQTKFMPVFGAANPANAAGPLGGTNQVPSGAVRSAVSFGDPNQAMSGLGPVTNTTAGPFGSTNQVISGSGAVPSPGAFGGPNQAMSGLGTIPSAPFGCQNQAMSGLGTVPSAGLFGGQNQAVSGLGTVPSAGSFGGQNQAVSGLGTVPSAGSFGGQNQAVSGLGTVPSAGSFGGQNQAVSGLGTVPSAGLFGGQNQAVSGLGTVPSAGLFGGQNQAMSGMATAPSAPFGGQNQAMSGLGTVPSAGSFGGQNQAVSGLGTVPSAPFGGQNQAMSGSGGVTPAFPAATQTNVFGTRVVTTATTSGFSFGGGAPQMTNGSVFGGSTNLTVTTSAVSSMPVTASTFDFGASNPTTAPPSTYGFGGSNPTTTAASTFSFGASNPKPTTASSFNFGASNPTSTGASNFNFGGSNPTAAAASTFNFGASNQTTTAASTFNFGASNMTTTAASFGTAAPAPGGTPFNFGGVTTNTGTASPAFGVAKTQPNATPVFGAATQPTATFQGGMTKSGSAPAFGGSAPSFGVSKPPNPFENSSSAMFGGTSAAPQTTNTAMGGGNVFGFGATTQPSASSTNGFSTAAVTGSTTTFNFGGNNSTASFGAGSTASFGAGSPASFGAGSPATPFGASTPTTGGFTVGANNTANKPPRILTKAKRRGTRR